MLLSAKLAPIFPYAELAEFWKTADELGFHAVWDYDHFYGLVDPSQDTLEGWTALGAMAVITKRARVGCMVTGVTYRHPAVLANMAVTVDHISGGRLDFGMGAAWHEMEHRGYGIGFPPAATRIAMLDEHCEQIGRDPAQVRRSVQLMLYPAQEGQAEELIARLPEYEEAGCQHAVLSFYSPPSRALLESTVANY